MESLRHVLVCVGEVFHVLSVDEGVEVHAGCVLDALACLLDHLVATTCIEALFLALFARLAVLN